jgi:hypothetical protein
LRRRHAEFVDFRTFDADVQRLIKGLKLGKKAELPGTAAEAQVGDGDSRTFVPGAAASLPEPFKPSVMPSKPVLAGLLVLLLGAGTAAYVMNTQARVDASPGLAEFTESEAGRRAAEARANQASDAVAIAVKARQEAEAIAAASSAAQTKSEEGRLAAEARAGEAADTLAKTDKARRDAEAKAAAAVTALARTEESRQAAETRASDAADALKKSEKARQEAESRANIAVTAQAKAEEGQRTAEKARFAAETAANIAASAKAQADNNRQFAEVRANDAAEALRKSEKARQDAEARLAAQAEVALKAARKLLTDLGNKSRWYLVGSGRCSAASDPDVLLLEVGTGGITWVNGYGRRDTETVLKSSEDSFHTDREGSRRAYFRNGSGFDVHYVQPSGPKTYHFERCS